MQDERRLVRHHHEWDIYRRAFDASMVIFDLSKRFPVEERYSLTDQIRRSSRSVCANLAEAWRRRRYQGQFVMRLNDAEAEAAETQTWLHYAVKCGYVDAEKARELFTEYDQILGALVNTIRNPEPWLIA